MTPFREIERDSAIALDYPALMQAASMLANPQVRNVATIGGNICNAAPSADGAPPLLVLDAVLVLEGPGGRREVAMEAFFKGPGQTALDRTEVITQIRIPEIQPHTGSVFLKAGRLKQDIALVNAAALVVMEGKTCTKCRIALGAVAPVPLRLKSVAISAVGNNGPALGYSVAYPFGFIAPFFCMYFANLWVNKKELESTGTGVELQEVVVRNQQVIGRPLAEIAAKLPAGVRIVLVREGNQNKVPAPDILSENDVLALAGESAEAIETARLLIGEMGTGKITRDRRDLDYFRLFVSRAPVVGVRLADPQIPDVPEFSVLHVRRGDADLLARPELVLEFGDRIGVLVNREHHAAVRRPFGDSIKGTTEFRGARHGCSNC